MRGKPLTAEKNQILDPLISRQLAKAETKEKGGFVWNNKTKQYEQLNSGAKQ